MPYLANSTLAEKEKTFLLIFYSNAMSQSKQSEHLWYEHRYWKDWSRTHDNQNNLVNV